MRRRDPCVFKFQNSNRESIGTSQSITFLLTSQEPTTFAIYTDKAHKIVLDVEVDKTRTVNSRSYHSRQLHFESVKQYFSC